MIRMILKNGQVYWKCKKCGHIEITNELEPPFYEDVDMYKGEK